MDAQAGRPLAQRRRHRRQSGQSTTNGPTVANCLDQLRMHSAVGADPGASETIARCMPMDVTGGIRKFAIDQHKLEALLAAELG